MEKQDGNWSNKAYITGVEFICGYCGKETSPTFGYHCEDPYQGVLAQIVICPFCNYPTFLGDDMQTPGPLVGRTIEHVPHGIESLYRESRLCFSVNAYTSSVLACRKILMNIAVEKGAEENRKFFYYVEWLEENRYLPASGKTWVDKIRTKGNEATHEISSMGEEEARLMISFVEMLLIFVYEFPNRASLL